MKELEALRQAENQQMEEGPEEESDGSIQIEWIDNKLPETIHTHLETDNKNADRSENGPIEEIRKSTEMKEEEREAFKITNELSGTDYFLGYESHKNLVFS